MNGSELITLPDSLPAERREEIAANLQVAVNAVLISMGVVDLSPQFKARRDAAVKRAASVPMVQTPEQEADAGAARKELSALEKEMDSQKGALKGPLDAAGKRILALIRDGLEPVAAAKKRLTDMMNGYADEQVARQRAAEEEIRRRQEEAKAAAEKLAAEAEKLRIAAERAAKAGKTELADQIGEKLHELQDDADLAELTPAPPAPIVAHAAGVSHRMHWEITFAGRNDIEQEAAMAEMIKLGFAYYFEIKPRKSVIQDALKNDPNTFAKAGKLFSARERASSYAR